MSSRPEKTPVAVDQKEGPEKLSHEVLATLHEHLTEDEWLVFAHTHGYVIHERRNFSTPDKYIVSRPRSQEEQELMREEHIKMAKQGGHLSKTARDRVVQYEDVATLRVRNLHLPEADARRVDSVIEDVKKIDERKRVVWNIVYSSMDSPGKSERVLAAIGINNKLALLRGLDKDLEDVAKDHEDLMKLRDDFIARFYNRYVFGEDDVTQTIEDQRDALDRQMELIGGKLGEIEKKLVKMGLMADQRPPTDPHLRSPYRS